MAASPDWGKRVRLGNNLSSQLDRMRELPAESRFGTASDSVERWEDLPTAERGEAIGEDCGREFVASFLEGGLHT
jgi:hypothetical protein